MTTQRYLERLAARVTRTRTVLCLGLDPDPDALPGGHEGDLRGVEALCRVLLDAAGPHASAVKANLAFFESWGSAGLAALERIRATVPSDIPFIADAKRGDIGSTSARHAVALFDVLGADAVTVSPYLGGEAIEPLLGRADRFVYVLCRTSNPGAGELQDLAVTSRQDGSPEPLYRFVARRAQAWQAGRGNVGLVVGATAPHELADVRRAAPELPFLVPGVGRQGGGVETVLAHGAATEGPAAGLPGGGLLVNVSRGIAEAVAGSIDPGPAADAAARSWAARLRV